MQQRGSAVLVSAVVLAWAAGLGLGCSRGLDSAPAAPAPDLETLRDALSERDGLERTYLLTSFLRTMRAEDVPGTLAAVEEHRIGMNAEEVHLLMLAWTRFDGPGAWATARDWPTGWSAVLMDQAMRAWGFNDGQAALAELEGITDVELRERLRGELVAGWVGSNDLTDAAEYAAKVELPRRRNRLAFRLAGQAMRDGPDAAVEWVDSLPGDAPNDFKQTVFIHAAGMVARADPARVVAWYERQSEHAYTEAALRNIAIKWAQNHEPKDAIAWLETLSIEETRESERPDAIRAAARIWAEDAPAEVEAWLESGVSVQGRDEAIREYARATVDASPTNALQWVGRIADEEQRRRAYLRYTSHWAAKDRAAATNWIEEADFSDALREQVLLNLKRRARSADTENDTQNDLGNGEPNDELDE